LLQENPNKRNLTYDFKYQNIQSLSQALKKLPTTLNAKKEQQHSLFYFFFFIPSFALCFAQSAKQQEKSTMSLKSTKKAFVPVLSLFQDGVSKSLPFRV
jgi:hypothetical protein